MDWPSADSYRQWDDKLEDMLWFEFGQRLSDSLRAQIRPLTAEYASQLWHWIFPTNQEVLPLVAKEKTGWLKKVFDSELLLFGDSEGSKLAAQLRRLLPWPESDNVFFLIRRGRGYQTSWGVYLQLWKQFLGGNEEGLLFHPTAREVLVFWETWTNKGVFVGRRSKRRLNRPSANPRLFPQASGRCEPAD